MTLALNVLVLGDGPEDVVSIEVSRTATVTKLKTLIKQTLAPRLDHASIIQLSLYMVDMRLATLRKNLPDTISTRTFERKPLSPNTEQLSSFFKDSVPPGTLHVIVNAPGASR